MEEYIKEVFLEEKKAIKDERGCVIFAGNLLDFNLTNLSKKSPTYISRGWIAFFYFLEIVSKIWYN